MSLAAPALAQATAIDAFYERAVMTAADQRCRLFTPELASALQAAEAQARGAALRSGYSGGQIAQVEERADAKVASVPCNSPDIALAATRVRAAFDGYAKLVRMNYPGDIADWTADRSTSRRVAIWKLSQTSASSPAASSGSGWPARMGRARWSPSRPSPAAPSPMPRGSSCAMRRWRRSPSSTACSRRTAARRSAARMPPQERHATR